MRFDLKILESDSEIAKKILDALLPQINNYMNDSIAKIKNPIKEIVGNAIRNSPEYDAIARGQLSYELGIPDPFTRMDGLISIWLNNVQFNYNKPIIANNKIKASFSVNMIKVDFSDVLFSDFAKVDDFRRGYSLPWLEWLLLEGNKIIVPKYEVLFGANRASRTGFALMKESTRSWRIPSTYAGTINNNWITRALDSASSDIKSLLDRTFE